jgi:hypothetical protein
MVSSTRWTPEQFQADCLAWVTKLGAHESDVPLSEWFSEWEWRSTAYAGGYLRRGDVHIALSPSIRVPCMIILMMPGVPAAPPPFVPDMHPVLNVPCFSMEVCQTPDALRLLFGDGSHADGHRLLTWYALVVNTTSEQHQHAPVLTPDLFLRAQRALA